MSAVSTIALVPAAFAADIYTPPPAPYAAVVLPNWAGFYLGINGGYGGNSSLGFRENVYAPNLAGGTPYSFLAGSTTIAGGFGGGQLGYNWQFGAFVAGFETDIQGADIQGSGAQAILNTTTNNLGLCGAPNGAGVWGGACAGKNDLQVDYFGTVRGRLGYVWGGTLLYFTGGLAYGGVRSSFSYTDNSTYNGVLACTATGCIQHGIVSNSSTNTGWVVGAGIEYKIGSSWSLKGEYQYIDLGSISTGTVPNYFGAGTPCAAGGTCTTLSGKNSEVTFNTVRVGLNYHFISAPEPLK